MATAQNDSKITFFTGKIVLFIIQKRIMFHGYVKQPDGILKRVVFQNKRQQNDREEHLEQLIHPLLQALIQAEGGPTLKQMQQEPLEVLRPQLGSQQLPICKGFNGYEALLG